MFHTLRSFCLLLAFMASFVSPTFAQEYLSVPETAATPSSAFNPAQIDQLTAPIALYPDTLVGSILMASTYPLEIVEANRWRQSMGNTQLTSDQLSVSLAPQPWDASVKSLVAFPEVLDLMDNNLQWTEQLGEAFIAQQGDVMNSIQKLRGMAVSQGTLATTPQLQVTTDDQSIVIQPTDPNYLYVPTYGPGVYGAWPWQNYQPYALNAPPGYVYSNAPYISYSPGIVIVGWLWGWNHWDWNHHHLDVDDDRLSRIDHDRPIASDSGRWHFDPQHRHEVPFHNAVLRQGEIQKRSHDTWAQSRGYAGPAEVRVPRPTLSPSHASLRSDNASTPIYDRTNNPIRTSNVPSSAGHAIDHSYPVPSHTTRPFTDLQTVQPRAVQEPVRNSARNATMPVSHVMPPLYESIVHAPDTQVHAQRGYSSRATMPQQQSVPRSNQSRPQHEKTAAPTQGTMRGHN